MGSRKLQIFLSSTYSDLADLRLSAIEAILAAGHIPATMEQFTPGDETALEVIRRWIGESDAFILMLGGRFGSVEPKSGKSYVQLEYEFAERLRKPLFAMLLTDEALQQRVQQLGLAVVDEREHQAEFRQFRLTVQRKLCSWFADKKDIRSIIFQKLPEWAQRSDLVGWVRATEAVSAQTAEEIARLSRENALLRDASTHASNADYDGISFEQMVAILRDDSMPDGPTAGEIFEDNLHDLSVGLYLDGEGVLRHQQLARLVAHGLVANTYKHPHFLYELTPVGRKFRNRLFTHGPRELRLKTVWGK